MPSLGDPHHAAQDPGYSHPRRLSPPAYTRVRRTGETHDRRGQPSDPNHRRDMRTPHEDRSPWRGVASGPFLNGGGQPRGLRGCSWFH
ncbi:MAG: hypothetical protein BIP78_1154 [Candidatus Bipolaricaulis sibiricus]|uniref:Uncharacterized protein n=1 Tax=Bipolaricaulis sibiricus TaxID=2501609 RepID=A0A410FVI9_BIPS1|nr:MAG: hypothetical protein BIP78_1154 [Candidatus Bipolaricaulis sibiricus]